MTPDPRTVRLDDTPPQPWRNGGGVTRELLTWPTATADATDDWQVRISVADIGADGPFSAFPGVQRCFCVLEGDGVDLTVNGITHRLRAGDAPLHFDGAARAHCGLLQGPTRDLNLMLRGRRGALVPAATPWQPPGTPWGLFTMQAGTLQWDGGASRKAVEARSLLCFDQGSRSSARFTRADASEPLRAWWWWSGDEPAESADTPEGSAP